MLRGSKFVRQPMNQVLSQGLLPQNVQKQGQKYVMKYPFPHQKNHQIPMGMETEMETAMVMVMTMVTATDRMDQMETETTTKVVKKFQLCYLDRLAAIKRRR
jgi:hypothetical protein